MNGCHGKIKSFMIEEVHMINFNNDGNLIPKLSQTCRLQKTFYDIKLEHR